jgi:hypothetical protein
LPGSPFSPNLAHKAATPLFSALPIQLDHSPPVFFLQQTHSYNSVSLTPLGASVHPVGATSSAVISVGTIGATGLLFL